ncbi:hypothetical protein WDW89_12810 [Deltaproteobacteria bacterium TL4]
MPSSFQKCGYIGILLIIVSLALIAVFPVQVPWMMDGFVTPIVAFEFVETPQEIYQMFQTEHIEEQLVLFKGMESGLYIDFLYAWIYAGFLVVFAFLCQKETGGKLFFMGMLISIFAAATDNFENYYMLRILSKFHTANLEQDLGMLHLFTWLKWGSLTVVFLSLLPHFFQGNRYAKLIGMTGGLAFLLALFAFFHRSWLNELLSLTIVITFVLMIIYCFTHKSVPS